MDNSASPPEEASGAGSEVDSHEARVAHAARVVFSLHDELLLFDSTGLAQLDNGPWPCGDGNLHGNPVRT